jgi:hypothetical protein
MLDQPDLAAHWCAAMLTAHREQLQQLPMQTEIIPNMKPQILHWPTAEHLAIVIPKVDGELIS